jgi:hypothetical protein
MIVKKLKRELRLLLKLLKEAGDFYFLLPSGFPN